RSVKRQRFSVLKYPIALSQLFRCSAVIWVPVCSAFKSTGNGAEVQNNSLGSPKIHILRKKNPAKIGGVVFSSTTNSLTCVGLHAVSRKCYRLLRWPRELPTAPAQPDRL